MSITPKLTVNLIFWQHLLISITPLARCCITQSSSGIEDIFDNVINVPRIVQPTKRLVNIDQCAVVWSILKIVKSPYVKKTKIGCDWLIDWIEFYGVSAIFQPCNGGTCCEPAFRTAFLPHIIFFLTLHKKLLKAHT